MGAYFAASAILHDAEFVTLDLDFRNFEKDGLKLSLQLDYELMRAARENGERIKREVQPDAA